MFTTDSRTENFLTSIGVKFEYRNGIILPSDLVKGWEKENIGRPVAIREEAVLEYSSLMEAGSAAPAPILIKTPDGLRVLDGVQRLSAAELIGRSRISSYVVITDSEDLSAMIRVLANARLQGRSEPAEWTRRRAVEVLVIERKMTHAEVASLGGWRKSDIQRLAKVIDVQKRITYSGGPKLPDTLLELLTDKVLRGSVLEKAAQPMVGFLETIKLAKMSAEDSEPYVEQFFAPLPRGSNPYYTYMERLKEVRTDPEVNSRLTGRRSVEMAKDVVLLRTLKSANTIIDEILGTGVPVTNIDEYFRLMNKISGKLKDISSNSRRKKVKA